VTRQTGFDITAASEVMAILALTRSLSELRERLARIVVGYTRAGRLVDMLERRGIISGYEGSKPRRVLIDESQVHQYAAPD